MAKTSQKHDWKALIAAFEKSNCTQTEFCRQHNITQSYFSKQRRLHLTQSFIPVQVQKPAQASCSTYRLTQKNWVLEFPSDTPAESVASLLKALS